jgi:hypothetical protein
MAVFLGGIVLLPMLINSIRDLDQPRLILDQFQQLQRGKELDAVFCGLPSGFNGRAVTSTGISCGWQLSTPAACFAVSRAGMFVESWQRPSFAYFVMMAKLVELFWMSAILELMRVMLPRASARTHKPCREPVLIP